MTIKVGNAYAPDDPGIGIDWDWDALSRKTISEFSTIITG